MSDKLAELYVEITAKTDKLVAGLDAVKKDTGKMSSAFGTASIAIGNFAAQAAMQITSQLGNAIQQVTIQAAQMADEILDTARATGLSTDEVQKFTLAAKMEGKGIETISTMFKFYSKEMEQAMVATKKGDKATGGIADAFEKLGINVQSFSLLSTAEQMDTLFRAVNNVANANDRATIAMQLFGRAGMDSLDVINTYVTKSSEIEAAAAKFNIPQASLESAAQLKETMGMLSFVFDNIAVKIGAALIPLLIQLTPLIIKIAEDMNKWLGNPNNVAQLESLVNGLGGLVNGIIQIMNAWNSLPAPLRALLGIGIGTSGGAIAQMQGSLKVTARASGGIVTKPELAMIGEAGPEAIIPLSQMGNMGGGSVVVNVGNYMGDEISKRALVRDIQRILNEESRRSSFKPTETNYYSVGGHL
jgi:hypothetical protein